MKIIIFSYYSGKNKRGVETWAENLKNNLLNKHKVEIIKGNNFAINSFLSLQLELFKNIFGNLSQIKDSDVVIPTNGGLQTFVCRLLTWIYRKPLIVFGHAGMGADDKWNLLCLPNYFVSFTEAQKKWSEKYNLPWTKVIVIPHAVDTSFFRPATKKIRRKVVLCVAANTPDKRVNLVKDAVTTLSGYTFVAVGKGNLREVTYTKMPKEYQSADVFCFVPKPHEAFGLVLLEALSTNLPVVTIDDAIRREIVGDAGIFVKHPEDQIQLSKAISKAYETDWGNKPREQAEKFSWLEIANKYDDFIEKITANEK